MRRARLCAHAVTAALMLTLALPHPAVALPRATSVVGARSVALNEPTWDIWNTAHVSDGGTYVAARRSGAVLFTKVGSGRWRTVTREEPGDAFDLTANGRYVYFVPGRHRWLNQLRRWDSRTGRHRLIVRHLDRFESSWATDRSGELVLHNGGSRALVVQHAVTGERDIIAPASAFAHPDYPDEWAPTTFVISPNGRFVAYSRAWRQDVVLFDRRTRRAETVVRTRGDRTWVPETVTDAGRLVMGERIPWSGRRLRVYDRGRTTVLTSPVKGATVTTVSGNGRRAILRREGRFHPSTEVAEWVWHLPTKRTRLVARDRRLGSSVISGYAWDLDHTGKNAAYVESGWDAPPGAQSKMRPARWRLG